MTYLRQHGLYSDNYVVDVRICTVSLYVCPQSSSKDLFSVAVYAIELKLDVWHYHDLLYVKSESDIGQHLPDEPSPLLDPYGLRLFLGAYALPTHYFRICVCL